MGNSGLATITNMQEILDTNVLLRFLVGDVAKQQKKAAKWFKEAEAGKRSIVIIPLVIAEASFVLETFYKKSRQDIADALEVFLTQKWLHIQDREVLLGLWGWYRKGLHFVDGFLLAWAQINNGKILTFDQEISLKESKSQIEAGKGKILRNLKNLR